jgi:hypothetical protein
VSTKKTSIERGDNHTGTATAPRRSSRTEAGAIEGGADPEGHFPTLHARIHKAYVQDGEPIGTMPPPAGPREAVRKVTDAVQGRRSEVLMDCLAERMAVERTGVRLYDLMLIKLQAYGTFEGGPTEEDILAIRADELDHFTLLRDAISGLGGDPTAMTPGADVATVIGSGLQKALADPRSDVSQALHALHVAEAADTDGWALLIELTEALGQSDLAERFRVAALREEEHLQRVHHWLAVFTTSAAGALAEATSPPG